MFRSRAASPPRFTQMEGKKNDPKCFFTPRFCFSHRQSLHTYNLTKQSGRRSKKTNEPDIEVCHQTLQHVSTHEALETRREDLIVNHALHHVPNLNKAKSNQTIPRCSQTSRLVSCFMVTGVKNVLHCSDTLQGPVAARRSAVPPERATANSQVTT